MAIRLAPVTSNNRSTERRTVKSAMPVRLRPGRVAGLDQTRIDGIQHHPKKKRDVGLPNSVGDRQRCSCRKGGHEIGLKRLDCSGQILCFGPDPVEFHILVQGCCEP